MRAPRVDFHPEADAELDAAVDWYRRRSPQAAARFLVEVDAAITGIVGNPFAGSVSFVHYRKWVEKHFPFCVYYRINDVGVLVLAIAHDHRNPGYWAHRH